MTCPHCGSGSFASEWHDECWHVRFPHAHMTCTVCRKRWLRRRDR